MLEHLRRFVHDFTDDTNSLGIVKSGIDRIAGDNGGIRNPQRDFELVADTPLLIHDAVAREKPQAVNSYNDAHLAAAVIAFARFARLVAAALS